MAKVNTSTYGNQYINWQMFHKYIYIGKSYHNTKTINDFFRQSSYTKISFKY